MELLKSYSPVFFFRACINSRCLLKKLNNENKCTVCGVQYSESSAGQGYVAKVLVQENEDFHTYTFFTQAMNSLKKSLNLSSHHEDLNEKLKEKLPIKISYIKNGDKLNSLEAI